MNQPKNINRDISTENLDSLVEDNLKLLKDYLNNHFNEIVAYNDQVYRLIGWGSDDMDYYTILKSIAPKIAKPYFIINQSFAHLFPSSSMAKSAIEDNCSLFIKLKKNNSNNDIKKSPSLSLMETKYKKRERSKLVYVSWVTEPALLKNKLDNIIYNKIDSLFEKNGCPKEKEIMIDIQDDSLESLF